MNITKPIIERTKQTKSIYQDDNKSVSIVFDIQSLNLFCMYVLSENSYIRSSNFVIMKKLFDRIDIRGYQNDAEKMKRIEFIQRALDARINKKIHNKDLILKYINGGFEDKPLLDIEFKELSTDEISWINNTVSESLKHSFMYDYIDKIIDVCMRFKAEDYNRRGDIVNEFEDIIDKVKAEFRRSKSESLSDMEFSLADGVFEEVVSDVYEREINPSRRLLTGMQGLNELCGGGLESGRVYMLFGMAGAGKSLTMLNIAYQIKKYNKNYVCKDKTKRPCVVLLTMENSIHETITRLYSIITGERMSHDVPVEEVIRRLREDGELYLNDDSPIDLYIKYKPNMSCDTTYLYQLADDLDDKGYEIICLLQDHIKRIRPAFSRKDLRLDLGEIVNDFKVFAVEKDIPVISDSHLNRDGARVIDAAISANKQDITRLLGRANVGESMLMLDNADCGIFLNMEYDKATNRQYMIMFRQKMRDDHTRRDYIAHPFVEGSTIRLVEDLLSPIPAFRESLASEPNINRGILTRNDYNQNIQNLDDDDNIFNQPQQISLSNMNYEMVGAPSVPVYNNYQNPQYGQQQSNGLFNQFQQLHPPQLKEVVIFDQ